jgi:cobalt-zinc-cadmium efflux system membrane fusion protein
VDGAGSRRAVEEAQAELAIADADLKAARERLQLADRGNVGGIGNGGITLEAQATALIRNVQASVGQTVAAGAPLFELVRLDTMWVRVPLYVGESGEIDPRAPARIVGLGDPAEAEGLIARPIPAPPSADASTAAVDLYFALSNQGASLRPGQRVGARLTRRGEAESLVVPRAALLHDAYGGSWVYEARPEHVYVRRRVDVADLVDAYVVLSQGPVPGTRVVTDGAAELFGTEFGAGK